MPITRRTAAFTAALALAIPTSVAATTTTATAAAYDNCDALHRDFPHGVAKSKAAAKKQVRDGYGKPATTKRAKRIYNSHKANLDRDKDGTACEA